MLLRELSATELRLGMGELQIFMLEAANALYGRAGALKYKRGWIMLSIWKTQNIPEWM